MISIRSILRPRDLLWPILVLFSSLAVTAAAWYSVDAAVHAKNQAEFDSAGIDIAKRIFDELEDYQQILWGGVGLLAVSPAATYAEWENYVDRARALQRKPGILGIGFIKYVREAEKDAYIGTIRAQGFPDYTVVPAGERKEYGAVAYLVPFDERVFGYDMLTDPVRREAMERARDNGAPAVSGKILLIQETRPVARPGFIMLIPVYREGVPEATPAERRETLTGFVYSPIRMRSLMTEVVEHIPQDILLEIYDGAQVREEALYFRSGSRRSAPGVGPDYSFSEITVREIFGRPWTFHTMALPSYVKDSDRQRPLAVLVAGVLISLLASSVVGVLVVNRAQALASNRTLAADVANRIAVEEQLRQSQRIARGIVDTALDAFIQTDETGTVVDWNPRAEAVFGWSRDEAVGKSVVDLIVPADRRARFSEGLGRYRSTGKWGMLDKRIEIDAIRKDGRMIKAELSVTALSFRNGHLFNAFARDLTEKIAADEQLRQSQKMEAIGQLTGGIAHDFNNLLTIIIGNAELLAERAIGQKSLADLAATVRSAARRGADLTRRLLAFSRRQTLQPKATDLNRLVREMEGLLRRTLRADIEIRMNLVADLWPAMVDAPQVENAILNLALNARDAMPSGGRLRIDTANFRLDEEVAATFRFAAAAGDYVALSIGDTGTGIPPELQERVFEPFFTTKEAGEGTGLGLSMVYGFVKQSGGFVNIYSEVGHGTVVKLCLPRAAEARARSDDEQAAGSAVVGGQERILVVEDDELVRGFVVLRLKEFGYKVIDAADGVAALALLGSEEPVDLLFTDVVLPKGMNGRALAEEARRRYPGLKVLFTSGYTQDAFADRDKLDPGFVLLNKPFEKNELARKIREALDAKA